MEKNSSDVKGEPLQLLSIKMVNRPHTFRIFGDFLYILNYSMRSFIGRIEEGDNLSHIHSGTLTVAPTASIKDGEVLLF